MLHTHPSLYLTINKSKSSPRRYYDDDQIGWRKRARRAEKKIKRRAVKQKRRINEGRRKKKSKNSHSHHYHLPLPWTQLGVQRTHSTQNSASMFLIGSAECLIGSISYRMQQWVQQGEFWQQLCNCGFELDLRWYDRWHMASHGIVCDHSRWQRDLTTSTAASL